MLGGAIHAIFSFVKPQNYNWESTKSLSTVEVDASDVPLEEFSDERLIRAKAWILKWGIGFTFVIVVAWPALSLPAKVFNLEYFTFWAVIAIAWGTIGSAVIILLPLIESWETIQLVLRGMFTNYKMEK